MTWKQSFAILFTWIRTRP